MPLAVSITPGRWHWADADAETDGLLPSAEKTSVKYSGAACQLGGTRVPRLRTGQIATRPQAHGLLHPAHDPETNDGRISTLLAKKGPKDRPKAQSRHVSYARCGGKARTRRAIFQAPLSALMAHRVAA